LPAEADEKHTLSIWCQ